MKIKILITAVTVFESLLSFSQENTSEVRRGFKYDNSYDLAFAAGADQLSGALSWLHFHSIGKKKKFKAGYGIRFTSYHGRNQNYLTAPAILTSKQTGPQVLFSETFPENIDTFLVSKAQSNSLNKELQLNEEDLKYSYKILDEYGNMASPTILFVLNELMEEKQNKNDSVFSIGFGPGLSIETALFRFE